MRMFKKVLVANRGEIAVRIIRTLKTLNIISVAVFTEKEKHSLHVEMADESYSLGNGDLSDTYLNGKKIIHIAGLYHCEAIHPGYGFLSENYEITYQCNEAGIKFIGPRSEIIQLMGIKSRANAFVSSLKIPVIPGIKYSGDVNDNPDKLDYPVLIKAAAGGGGKGMHIAWDRKSFESQVRVSEREAASYFGNGNLIIEKYVHNARHIEVQILGDSHGNQIHLFERECTVQRRHQKIIEESPADNLSNVLKQKLFDAAMTICKKVNYEGAGTVEFLVTPSGSFYFLEMNTRIQVEHGVTELLTGIDIVEEQIRIASGEELRFGQDAIKQKGHAIEARLYAENPSGNFEPSPGKITLVKFPLNSNYRLDTYIQDGTEISPEYDPMIAKIIVAGKNKSTAIEKLDKILNNVIIHGIDVNTSLLRNILKSKDFRYSVFTTQTLEENVKKFLTAQKSGTDQAILATAGLFISLFEYNNSSAHEYVWQDIGYWRIHMVLSVRMNHENMTIEIKQRDKTFIDVIIQGREIRMNMIHLNEHHMVFETDGNKIEVFYTKTAPGEYYLSTDHNVHEFGRSDILKVSPQWNVMADECNYNGNITAPLPGRIVKLLCYEGQHIQKGQEIIGIESMKMENSIRAQSECRIKKIYVGVGDTIEKNQTLIEVDSELQKTKSK